MEQQKEKLYTSSSTRDIDSLKSHNVKQGLHFGKDFETPNKFPQKEEGELGVG